MEQRWRIREFAGRVGVPETTLRAWERRYHLLAPVRSPGGYRLYTADDERRVAAMRAHMDRGLAAGEAARHALAEQLTDLDIPADGAALCAGFLEAVAAFDATRSKAMLDGAFALGTAIAIREVLLPALRAIGDRWASGELTVAHEHFASHLVERRLLRETATWDERDGPVALLACPSGERHTLGLLCFAVALAERGWRVAYLGGDMPLGHVHDAARSIKPDLVVLSTMDARLLTENAPLVRALGAEARTLIAGPGATGAVAKRVHADRLALDPVAAAAAV